MKFSVLAERKEYGYHITSIPELFGCHTQVKTLDEPKGGIKESIELCLESKE